MCGITGFFGETQIDVSRYYHAHSLLDHRGPDDEGFLIKQNNLAPLVFAHGNKTIPEIISQSNHVKHYKTASMIFGHHRLKILDLSALGHQPMKSACGNISVVYNGEIYNYKELREELKAKYTFYSNSDTEVLLASYNEWGVDCFKKFNGMWSIALYDGRTNEIVLARDRFGVKPLYYSIIENTVYFASEIKFFLGIGINFSLNLNAVKNYLYNMTIANTQETFFNEIQAFPPASYGIFSTSGLIKKIEPYWKLSIIKNNSLNFQDSCEKLRELLLSSINLRMRSDVPVGTLLSGGLDSTAIACLMSALMKNSTIESFSSVYQEVAFSEEEYIRNTIDFSKNIKSHFIYPNPIDIQNDFNDLMTTIETPFRSLAVYCQYSLYKFIKQNTNIIVLLNGQGSDEIFGGYTQHYQATLYTALSHLNLPRFLSESFYFFKYRKNAFMPQMRNLLKNIVGNKYKILLKNLLSDKRKNSIFKLENNLTLNEPKGLDKLLTYNLQQISLPEYLMYEDRNSMRFSMESRLPFLDYRLVEFAFSLPDKFKIHRGINKKIVRSALKHDLPEMVVNRKDKMGFTTPQELWQKNELKDWIIDGIKSPDNSNIFDQSYINSLLDDEIVKGNTWFWWRIFCFKNWYKNFYQKDWQRS